MIKGGPHRRAHHPGARPRRSPERKPKLLIVCVGVVVFLAWRWLIWTRLAGFRQEEAAHPSSVVWRTMNGIPHHVPRRDQCTSFAKNISYRFYPRRFFERGPGRQFLPNLQHNQDNFTDILNARFLVFHVPSLATEYGCSIVHFHIHKNGGTTLERHVPLPTDNFYSKREKALGHEEFESASRSIMRNVYDQQQQELVSTGGPMTPSVRTFTFLRDPVSRFLSSVAQVLKLRVWHKRLYPCYQRNTTEELLDCVLDKMEAGSIPEMHLAPQSFELYKQVMGFDIHIDLMDLSEIGPVMEKLGAGKVPRERSTTGTLIRRFPQFRLTMDALNSERISRICLIYAADVQMVKEAKATKTLCK